MNIIFLYCSLALSTRSEAGQKTFDFQSKPRIGEITRMRHTILSENPGMKVIYTHVGTEKIISNENGVVTIESTMTDAEMSMNGKKVAAPPESKPSRLQRRLSGELIDTNDKTSIPFNLQLRIGRAFSLCSPIKPVLVGQEWTVEFKSDPKLSLPSGRGKYVIEKLEKSGSVEILVVKFSYRELDLAKPLIASGTRWIDASNYTVLRSESELENYPVPGTKSGATVNLKLTAERI